MNLRILIATLLLLAGSGAAQAVSLPTCPPASPPPNLPTTLDLKPSASTVAQNSAFTVDLLLDATYAPGCHNPARISGQVNVTFDKTKLSYTGFALGSGLTLPVPPAVTTNGNTQTVFIFFENGPDLAKVGTFSFTAIGAPGSLATIGLADADDFFGSSFVNKNPAEDLITNLRFTGTQVNIAAVPLPAGVWLLGTGLGALVARRRRRPAAA